MKNFLTEAWLIAVLVVILLFAGMANAQTQHHVNLSWTPGVGCAVGTVCPVTGYNVYRTLTAGVNEVVIGTSTTPSYADLTVTGNTTYVYKVSALCATCTTVESAKSAPLTVTVPPDVPPPTTPAAPTNLKADVQ